MFSYQLIFMELILSTCRVCVGERESTRTCRWKQLEAFSLTLHTQLGNTTGSLVHMVRWPWSHSPRFCLCLHKPKPWRWKAGHTLRPTLTNPSRTSVGHYCLFFLLFFDNYSVFEYMYMGNFTQNCHGHNGNKMPWYCRMWMVICKMVKSFM